MKGIHRNITTLKVIYILTLAILLPGCALHSKEFDCKYEKGVGCRSISEVNQMVDKGVLKDKSTSLATHSETAPLPAVVMSDQGMIQRVQEEHLRVWVAPHQDEQGNFHEACLVHSVIKPGYWQLVE